MYQNDNLYEKAVYSTHARLISLTKTTFTCKERSPNIHEVEMSRLSSLCLSSSTVRDAGPLETRQFLRGFLMIAFELITNKRPFFWS